jgi:glycine cleavage system H lipoate-binding protein
MTCPFLKEAQVKYCRTSSIRKLIPLAQAGRTEERCSSEHYLECPVFREQPDAEGLAAFGTCPLLHESLMQYCGAAPVAKFVPYSESLLSRCGNDSHRYCELYLQMAHPLAPPETADGIPMPAELGYSVNHLWLDLGGDGLCHVGIDAFLARALGEVQRIDFVWQKGRHRPTAVVTAAGVDLEITLPFPLQMTACNLYLRANPARLTGEPYTGGWLFAGVPEPALSDGLLRGEPAQHWMEDEVRKVNEFLLNLPGPAGHTAADGGMFSAGLARYIEREQMLALFHEFFSPLREQEVRP